MTFLALFSICTGVVLMTVVAGSREVEPRGRNTGSGEIKKLAARQVRARVEALHDVRILAEQLVELFLFVHGIPSVIEDEIDLVEERPQQVFGVLLVLRGATFLHRWPAPKGIRELAGKQQYGDSARGEHRERNPSQRLRAMEHFDDEQRHQRDPHASDRPAIGEVRSQRGAVCRVTECRPYGQHRDVGGRYHADHW